MATPNVPTALWLGRTENEWPIHVWESETSAMAWLQQKDTLGNKRHVWIITVTNPVEYELVYTEPRLEPVK